LKKKVLITGHKGFIGTPLVCLLKASGYEVHGMDLVDGDNVIDIFRRNVDYRYHYDYVIHLACFPRVGHSIEHPLSTMVNNVIATSFLLDYCRKSNVKRFIFASSSSVYGDNGNQMSPYALQKYTSEKESLLYHTLYDLDVVCLRLFNVYHESNRSAGKHGTLVAKINHHLYNQEPVTVFGNGEIRRDMAYLDDVTEAFKTVMEHQGSFTHRTMDVGTGHSISVNEVIELAKRVNPSLVVKYTTPRVGDMLYTCADIEPLKQINWKLTMGIREGIMHSFRFNENGQK